MGIRQRVVNKTLPEVHKVAPNLNSSFVHRTVERAIHGVGPLPPAADGARKLLEENEGNVEDAISDLVRRHTSVAGAQGFVTNLGGLAAAPATIPLNIAGLALLQTRLIAAIAHLRGYHLADPRVHNAILICTLGEELVLQLVKEKKIPGTPMVVATAPAHDPVVDTLVAGEVTSALVNRVIGKRAAGVVLRRVPVVGGVWGGSADAFATYQVGRYADREFRQRPPG